jgi:hypothetical protein
MADVEKDWYKTIKDHPIWSKVVATLIAALIISFVIWIFPGGWNTFGAWVSGAWGWLGSSLSTRANISIWVIVLFGLVVALITHWRKTHTARQRDPKPNIPKPTPIAANTRPSMPAPEYLLSEHRVSDLSHKQISDIIEAVPPLHRESIGASFIGVYVSWQGKLFAASRSGEEARVSLSAICEKGGLVHCVGAFRDCDALLIAPEGAELIVKGKIAQIHKCGASLDDCHFETLHKSIKQIRQDSPPIGAAGELPKVSGIAGKAEKQTDTSATESRTPDIESTRTV